MSQLHATVCGNCHRILAFSDGHLDKMKLMRCGYRDHMGYCKGKYGRTPKMQRYDL